MSRPNPLVLIGILALLGGGLSWLTYSTGVYYLSEHEGDTVHLLDIIFRMQDGAVPHLDFVTPLGIFSFLPFVYLLESGYSVGKSLLYGQMLVAVVLAPVILYVAWSRLSALAGYALVAISMILLLAFSYGGTTVGTTLSMYYNRWAWVAASALVLIALLPSRRAMPVFDGILMGVLFSLLALTKMTFCVMLLPGVLFALLFQNRQREFYLLIGTGLVAVVLVAAVWGVDFWRAYASDLMNVSGSEVRPHTGFSFSHLVASPEYLPLTAIGLLAYYYLSRAGHRPQALGILILFPGFLYISWQNFGNDPVWLVPVLAVLLTYVSLGNTEDDGNTQKLAIVAVLAAMFILPWGLTMAMSPLWHATQDIAEYEPVLPERRPGARDIYVRRDRGFSMLAQTFQDDPGDAWDANAGLIERPEPRQIDGIPFPRCEFMAGSMNWLMQITDDLVAMDIPVGSQFFTTDVLTSFWLYGPYEPLRNGAPWYYSDLSGIENADFLIVPKCGFAERVRQIIIQDVIDGDVGAELFGQTDRVAVFTLP